MNLLVDAIKRWILRSDGAVDGSDLVTPDHERARRDEEMRRLLLTAETLQKRAELEAARRRR